MAERSDVIVIGAGWAGLTAARQLGEAGLKVQVLDKARGPGGRSSTRRIDGLGFDHGAQYFTARGAAFGRQLQQWRDAGLVAHWRPRVAVFGGEDRHGDPRSTARYVGVPGMNAVCSRLAETLDCRYLSRVDNVRHSEQWQVMLENGQVLESPRLLLTCPPAQAAALLGGADALFETLDQVVFLPCMTAMVAFADEFDPGFDAAFVNQDSPLAWVANDSSKPGRSGHCWVLQAGPEWSAAHLEDDCDRAAQQLLDALAVLAGTELPAHEVLVGHRWRYARAARPEERHFIADEARGLCVAGDWLSGNRIEGAWLSGRRAGEWLAQWGSV